MNLFWRTVRVNIQLNLMHTWGYVALAALILWVVAVPSMGVNKVDLMATTQELGYPPLSDARLTGLGAAQIASGFMTLFGVFLFLHNLDRERTIGLDHLFVSLPVSGWRLALLQYISNLATLLLFTVVAYFVALVAYPFRGFTPLSLVDFFWPGVLFPLGSAFLLASLPLFFDAIHVHHVARVIVYCLLALVFNMGPFALAVMSHIDHPLHPMFEGWFTANLGLDTVGIWYLQGYTELVMQSIEQLGTPVIPSSLYWKMIVRPRLLPIVLGLVLAAFGILRFDRFRSSVE